MSWYSVAVFEEKYQEGLRCLAAEVPLNRQEVWYEHLVGQASDPDAKAKSRSVLARLLFVSGLLLLSEQYLPDRIVDYMVDNLNANTEAVVSIPEARRAVQDMIKSIQEKGADGGEDLTGWVRKKAEEIATTVELEDNLLGTGEKSGLGEESLQRLPTMSLDERIRLKKAVWGECSRESHNQPMVAAVAWSILNRVTSDFGQYGSQKNVKDVLNDKEVHGEWNPQVKILNEVLKKVDDGEELKGTDVIVFNAWVALSKTVDEVADGKIFDSTDKGIFFAHLDPKDPRYAQNLKRLQRLFGVKSTPKKYKPVNGKLWLHVWTADDF